MLVWLIYDITENKVRNRIAKIALQHGLYRVQKSVYLGTIDKNNLDEVILKSEELINPKTDSLYAFPMCEKDFKSVILKGQAFDENLVTDKVKALFI